MSRAKCLIHISTGKGEEAKKKWVQIFPQDFKIFMAGLPKNDFTKQPAYKILSTWEMLLLKNKYLNNIYKPKIFLHSQNLHYHNRKHLFNP